MSLVEIDQAYALIEQACPKLPEVALELAQALNRVTAAPLTAQCDLPPFDQSAMDGYALNAADTTRLPARLPLAQTIAAGAHDSVPVLEASHACRIYTGGIIPNGANAVVRQEWVQRDDAHVVIDRNIPVGHDLRRQGEELSKGAHLIDPGRRLNAGHLAMLGMAGVATVKVQRAPRIRVLVSGDEVIEAGRPLRPGEVYNANGPLISAWLQRSGYSDVSVEALADDERAVSHSLDSAFSESDLVLTSGGVSVGDRDLIAPEAEKLGARRILWKVAQKPGKPLYVAQKDQCLLMGLPGNPGSVLVNLASFVRRALDTMEAQAEPGPAIKMGVLRGSVKADAARECWVRVRTEIDANGVMGLHPQTGQASHMLSNLARVDAIVRVPRGDTVLPAGSLLPWLSLGL